MTKAPRKTKRMAKGLIRGLRDALDHSRKSATMQYLEDVAGRPLTFGGLLASIREGEEVSLPVFSKMLGISPSLLRDIEKGLARVSPERAKSFAKALGRSTEQFAKLARKDPPKEEKTETKTVIAVRRLRQNGAGEVTASIGMPLKVSKDHWECPFWLADREPEYASGIDGMQALIMALEGIRSLLASSGKTYSWLGGQDQSGFPMTIPQYYGSDFERSLIDQLERAVRVRAAELAQSKKR